MGRNAKGAAEFAAPLTYGMAAEHKHNLPGC